MPIRIWGLCPLSVGRTLTENYYYGCRRYPYTTDMGEIKSYHNNPLTFRDIDPTQGQSARWNSPKPNGWD